MIAQKTLDAINAQQEASQSSSHRRHLGASIIGRPCAKQLWYIHRWAKRVRHRAQLLRLFQRGHDEEFRFVKYLTDIGCKVWEVDPSNGEQFRIIDGEGHFGGSLDGVAMGVPDVPAGLPCLLEFKTHGLKSFKKLIDAGLVSSKWEHYVQMQVYMAKMNLKWGLYMAVCKDNDELHLEIVRADDNVADRYIEKGCKIISSFEAPEQVSFDSAYWLCKFCDFTNICHGSEPVEKNCRTCVYVSAAPNGQWACGMKHRICKGSDRMYETDVLDTEGCVSYSPNPNM